MAFCFDKSLTLRVWSIHVWLQGGEKLILMHEIW